MTGAIGYNVAIPIIMGQNIGTCVTAMISSIGASKNAKRAALVHLYFNIIGTILFMVVFYAINAIYPFSFMEMAADQKGIATVHSVFNVAATVCLLPFSNLLVKLACLTVKEEEDKPEELIGTSSALNLLDARFLEIPSYAVEQSRNVAINMAELAEEAMNLSLELISKYNKEKAEKVLQLEKEVDRFEDELGTYLVKLSSKNLSEKDSHTLSEILHCIGDFERISDHALTIRNAAEEMHSKKLKFSDKAQTELEVLGRAIHDILKITMLSFSEEDLELSKQVEPLEEVIDELNMEIKQRHVRRLRKGKCTIELGFILSDITTNLERVSDHCSNIAVCLLQVSEDEYETHAYLGEMKQESNIEFQGKVMAYRERYQLP